MQRRQNLWLKWVCFPGLIVLKPSLVTALSLFLCVIKTNKPWHQTETGSGKQNRGRRRDLNIQPSSVGESKREPVSWTVENNQPLHITSFHTYRVAYKCYRLQKVNELPENQQFLSRGKLLLLSIFNTFIYLWNYVDQKDSTNEKFTWMLTRVNQHVTDDEEALRGYTAVLVQLHKKYLILNRCLYGL